jgi:hypothetical protein
MAPVLNHAGRYAIHIGNELPAQALRVALAGSPLVRRALGSGGNGHQRQGAHGGDGWKQHSGARDRIFHAKRCTAGKLINLPGTDADFARVPGLR